MSQSEAVWVGAPALRSFLVPIGTLEPFVGNPRRGSAPDVAASLERFGQVRPVLVDGSRIVAGHHVVEAARSLGWTHVAAIPNEFADEGEARAYLLADNRLGELGGYDDSLLSAQLSALRSYEGTGYAVEDADRLRARLAEAAATPPARPERVEVALEFATAAERASFLRLAAILEREWGTAGVTEAVVRAVREAAQRA